MDEHRSGCPINLTLEVLGDRWSLIVIRDVMFGNRRHFRELLTRSEEGIASIADRLKRLVEVGLLASKELSIRAELLEEGGPPMWEAFMAPASASSSAPSHHKSAPVTLKTQATT
jgi:hypothetical protein